MREVDYGRCHELEQRKRYECITSRKSVALAEKEIVCQRRRKHGGQQRRFCARRLCGHEDISEKHEERRSLQVSLERKLEYRHEHRDGDAEAVADDVKSVRSAPAEGTPQSFEGSCAPNLHDPNVAAANSLIHCQKSGHW